MSAVTSAILDSLSGSPSEIDQVITVLEAAGHEAATMSVAVGDRLVVDLAEKLTGEAIELTARCPGCDEVNVFTVTSDALPRHWPRSRWLGPHRGVRAPTYQDLLRLPASEAPAMAELVRRCSLGPVEVDEALAALEDLDDSLAGPIESTCVECGADMVLDIDLQQLALRRLWLVAERAEWEIHVLASTYHWDPATIETLSEPRRRRLVQLIEAGR